MMPMRGAIRSGSRARNTTRRSVRGVLHRPGFQAVFVDTPGLHRPRTALGRRLNEQIGEALDGIDVVVPVLDATLRDHICDDMLAVLLADNCKTRWLQQDGTYVRRKPRGPEPLLCAQDALLAHAEAV